MPWCPLYLLRLTVPFTKNSRTYLTMKETLCRPSPPQPRDLKLLINKQENLHATLSKMKLKKLTGKLRQRPWLQTLLLTPAQPRCPLSPRIRTLVSHFRSLCIFSDIPRWLFWELFTIIWLDIIYYSIIKWMCHLQINWF